MGKDYLRTYQVYDIECVTKHLLILGDLRADCGACRALGIDPAATLCPECRTEFKYATSRRSDNHPGERFQIVKRFQQKRPELTFIDFGDYSKITGQKKARDFFG